MIIIFILISKIIEVSSNLFYVGATDILPEPLNKEDEEKYLLLAKQGDIEAKNKLIEHNLRLVVFLAKEI